MNNQPQKILNAEQSALVAELSMTYGIEPEEIIFFDNESTPFLTYEANWVLCNHLTSLIHIGVEPVPSAFTDSVSVKCSIIFKNGNERSAVGVANIAEKINERDISQQQAINLASSRALRSVLRASGIDLIKLHHQSIKGEVLDFQVKSNYNALLGQAHRLGTEAELIIGDDKSAWYRLLKNRYGVQRSNELSEDQLADFVAILKTLVPQGMETKLAA